MSRTIPPVVLPGALVARGHRVEGRPDLISSYQAGTGFFFEHRGSGVAASGSALAVTVPAGPGQVSAAAAMAEEALASIRVEHGPSPVVMGALPFDGLSPATLTVPAVAWIRDADGATWRITVRPDGAPGADEATPSRNISTSHGPSVLDVEALPEPDSYLGAVYEARRRIRAGDLQKVVLARMLVVRAGHDFDRLSLLERLRVTEPDAYVFAVQGFIGATPELLVARSGQAVLANPLAGTAARRGDLTSDAAAARALQASAKERHEHSLVVEAVRAALAPACRRIDVDPEPTAVPTGQLWHLSTEVRGVLKSPTPSALVLAGLLHPTPAVCGTPTEAAMAAIRELEQIDRTLYAGLVGWMDADGDGEWALALRCAEVQGHVALLFAGAGIVADSEPEAELEETDGKFRAMLDALGWA